VCLRIRNHARNHSGRGEVDSVGCQLVVREQRRVYAHPPGRVAMSAAAARVTSALLWKRRTRTGRAKRIADPVKAYRQCVGLLPKRKALAVFGRPLALGRAAASYAVCWRVVPEFEQAKKLRVKIRHSPGGSDESKFSSRVSAPIWRLIEVPSWAQRRYAGS
jgi:hypothetical protein